MTRDEFLIRLGIEIPETPEMQKKIDSLLERVRREINENVPKMDIKIGNTEEVLKQLSNLNAKINGFENADGDIESISIAFDNTRGNIVKVNSNLEQTLRLLSDVEKKDINLKSVEYRKDLISKGMAYDSFGSVITDKRKVAQIGGILEDSSTISYMQNVQNLTSEYEKNLSNIISLEKKKDDAQRSSNERYIQDIQKQIEAIKERNEEILKSEDVKSRIDIKNNENKQNNATEDRQQKAYQNILNITKKIEDIRTKAIGKDETETESLNIEIRKLEKKLEIEKEIANLTNRQEQEVSNIQGSAKEQQNLKGTKGLLLEIEEIYSDLFNLTKKIDSAPEHSESLAYYKLAKKRKEEELQASLEAIKSDSNYSIVLSNLTKIQNEYNNKKREQAAIHKTIKQQQEDADAVNSYKKNISEITSLEKQRDEQQRNGNVEYEAFIKERISALEKEQNVLKKNYEVQKYINENGLEFKKDSRSFERQQNVYQNVLNITKKIEEIKTKSIGISRIEAESLNTEIRNLEEKLRVEREITTLTDRQKQEIAIVQNDAKKEQSLKRTKLLLSEISSLYQELQQASMNSMRAEDGSTEKNYYNQLEKDIQDTISQKDEELKKDKNLSLVLKERIVLEENYKKAINEQRAKKATSEDEQKIREAIKAYQDLKKAQIELKRSEVSGKASGKTLEDQSNAVKELEHNVEKYEKTLLSNGKTVKQTEQYTEQKTKADREAKIAVDKLNDGIERNTSSLNTVSGSFARVIENVIKYNLAQFGLVENMRKAVETVKELDAAMTDIRLVTGESADSARESMASYSALAQELGATTVEVAKGALEWRRQGYEAEEAGTLIKASTMLAKLGMMDEAEASRLLTAALNGYQLTAEDAVATVDKLVNIDLISATSSEELATSLQYVSSQAKLANVSLDKMIGYIATVSETTRLSAETIDFVA